MHHILIFKRPATNRFSKLYYDTFKNQAKISYISNFKFNDDVNLIARQHVYLSKKNIGQKLSEINYHSVISRDRYLKFLSESQSIKLINATWLSLIDIWDEYNPKAFIGLPIDNYYLDLIDLICTKRNTLNIAPMNSPFLGLSRITRRGEYIKIRTPCPEEIQKQLQILKGSQYKPEWLASSRTKFAIFKLYIRERIKKVVFTILKLAKNDPYNSHYNTIYPMPGVITIHSYKNISTSNYFCSNKRKLENRISTYRRTVFFALQFSPESSLNYYIDDYQFSDYNELTNTIIRTLPKDTLLIVKEHPAMLGYRNPQFYNRFLNQDNIALVDINTSLQYLFDHSDCVMVTGSATIGIEAIAKGKTVISLGGAYYGINNWAHNIKSFQDISSWISYIDKSICLSKSELDSFIEFLLSCTIEHNYTQVRIKNYQVENAKKSQVAIKNYILNQLRHSSNEIH